ncbi:DNA-processing protein DprA [uncultured Shewanella sp.]|uniref:DNA-processing protein DprA n=1 Tax=uncultured Shewanella sp. TaxID=173975 RepID=UPI00260E7DA9|nr:DNA-processing protein DprA [uncultured Shewanella sp.]
MTMAELRDKVEHEPAALASMGAVSSKAMSVNFALVERALNWQNSDPLHHIIYPQHAMYPPLLNELSDPPSLLFIKGELNHLLVPSIAIVGSRSATQSGLTIAHQLASELALMGLNVVSGMAIGIDGAAHQGALDVNGRSFAVLGTGIDIIYPKRHERLYHAIYQQGCIISEFWPQVKPYAGNFPRRNRIISGLSLGTLVVEAARKSGSLITARLAMEQGREVFAVPGNILTGQSQGCHDLLRNGAKLVDNAQDIVEELAALCHFHLEQVKSRHHIEVDKASDLPFASLLASVGYETTPIDVVVEHSGKTIELVLEQLLELELQGWVTAVPGGYVKLKRS